MSSDQAVPKPIDAGNRSVDHYKYRLPRWRLALRNWLIPLVRAETPYLAALQQRFRSPAWDTYFALTAILGTHTFYMAFIPMTWWCGHSKLGRDLVHILAAGVFWSGYLKDLLCLPRPLSPPLQRISRSTSAALEYGFPSTHSTNAVSVVIYVIYTLYTSDDSSTRAAAPYIQFLLFTYALSIIFGRLYCGMHGFFDVVIGALLGAIIGVVQCLCGDLFDDFIWNGPFKNFAIVILMALALVRVHPEPADDCPCYEDSVAFIGTFIGCELGAYRFVHSPFANGSSVQGAVPYSYEHIGLIKTIIRIFLGVFVIFAWRGVMKPVLLRILPPIFRAVGRLGLLLPRKFFLSASQYTKVPTLRSDDNVIPSASEIPAMIGSLRHPRKRAISIGPQSEADAYETMAFRERRRRESLSEKGHSRSSTAESLAVPDVATSTSTAVPEQLNGDQRATKPVATRTATDKGQAVWEVREMPDQNGIRADKAAEIAKTLDDPDDDGRAEDDRKNAEMFLRLMRPRVRYDVEVITKLIVYTGIGWLACEGSPILFEMCGIGTDFVW